MCILDFLFIYAFYFVVILLPDLELPLFGTTSTNTHLLQQKNNIYALLRQIHKRIQKKIQTHFQMTHTTISAIISSKSKTPTTAKIMPRNFTVRRKNSRNDYMMNFQHKAECDQCTNPFKWRQTLKWKCFAHWFPSAEWSWRAQRSVRSWAHSWTCSGRSSAAVGWRCWRNSDLLSRTVFGLLSPAVRSWPLCGLCHRWAGWRWWTAARPCALGERWRSTWRMRKDSCHQASWASQGSWFPKGVEIWCRLHFLWRKQEVNAMRLSTLLQ